MKSFYQPVRRMLFSILAIVASCCIATAQDLSTKIPKDPDVVTGKLPNGLTYYIRTNHKPEHKVELRLVINAGSILEDKDQQGLAHFMEHMEFNGLKHFEKNELVNYLQGIGVKFGADLNANTGFDRTLYILPIPLDKPDNLEKGFQILEDWAHNALLTGKDIDEERGVVLEEYRLGLGAEDRMRKIYFPKLVEGSLYADRLPIGQKAILDTFRHETIRRFYHDWYRPDLMAVVVVGDIDVATAKKMIMDHFKGLVNPPHERERTYAGVVPRKTPDAMVVTDKEATNSVLLLTFPYAKKHYEETLGDYKNDLERNLVTAMMDRHLSDLAKGSNPPFPFAGVGFDDFIHGYEGLEVFALFGKEGPEKAINAVTAELERSRKFGFTESDLELAKKDMLSQYEKQYNERKTTESKDYVNEYVDAFMEKEPFPGIDNEYNYVKKMLPEIKLTDLDGLVGKWMANTNTFALVMAPDKSDLKLPSDKELLQMTQSGFHQQITKESEKQVATSLMDKKPTPGKVVSQVMEDGFDATTYTLSNGIKVTIKPTNFKTDEILMTGVKKGGANSYGVADKSNVNFATQIADGMGVGNFAPSDLEKVLAGKEIKVSLSIGDINDNISASSTVKDFESMLQLMYMDLEQPRKDDGLFKAFKEKQLMMVQYSMSNPRIAFIDTTVKTIYGNNPLAKIVIPKPEDFDKLNLDRVVEIYRNEFSSADGYHFFIVGNIKPETAIPLIETYLGSLPANNKPVAFKDNGVRRISGKKELTIKKGSEKQSLIIGVFSGEIAYSEDLALKAQALAEVLNIKIIEDLREKMSGIYTGGISANVVKDPYENYTMQLQLPCGPENVEKLIAAAKAEIDTQKMNGPQTKDLDKVKSQWHEKHLIDVKENKYWTGKLESALFWNRDKDRIINYENYINKLTPAEIQETAKKLFDGKNEFISALYPES